LAKGIHTPYSINLVRQSSSIVLMMSIFLAAAAVASAPAPADRCMRDDIDGERQSHTAVTLALVRFSVCNTGFPEFSVGVL